MEAVGPLTHPSPAKSERRIAVETAATLLLVVAGLVIAVSLLFGPELNAWIHAAPAVASPTLR